MIHSRNGAGLAHVVAIVELDPARTIFTRFIPLDHLTNTGPAPGAGNWC